MQIGGENVAKDGTNRGGPRPGTGPKRKPLVDKIQDGTAKGTLVMPDDLPEPADIQGEDVPPIRDYLKAKQKNGSNLCAEEIFRETWLWLKARGCEMLVNNQLIEQYAMSVGVDIKAFRTGLIVLSSVLSATVTAFAGPISFVGIAVPHIIRSVTATSRPIVMIPQCFLGGAVFCLFCDLLARNLFAPTEISISTMTAVFGAPVVIVMLIGKKSR